MKIFIKNCFIAALLLFLFQNTVNAADDYIYKGEYKKAYKIYANALSAEKNARNYYDMCKITNIFNDYKTASSYCKAALKETETKKNPDMKLKADILAQIGDMYLKNGSSLKVIKEYYKEAETLKLKEADTDIFALAMLYTNSAYAYYNAGEKTIAVHNYLEKAAKLSNSQPDAKFSLVRARINYLYALNEKDKKQKKYMKAYKEYLDKAINELENSIEYSDCLFLAKLYKEMSEYYECCEKNKEKKISYRQKYTDEIEKFPCPAKSGDKYEIARLDPEELAVLNKEFPYDIDVNTELGYRNIRNEEKSENYFKKAININPESGYTMLAIAGSYCEQYMKTKDKIYLYKINEYIKSATEKAMYSPKIYKGAGLIKLLVHSYKSAHLYYNDYIKYSSNKPAAQIRAASDYWEYESNSKEINKVIIYAQDALDSGIEPDESTVRMLISAYKKTGKEKKAAEIQNKYLR